MQAIRLQLATKTLLNPSAAQWGKAPALTLPLRGTRADLQPSQYIRTVWAGKRIGAVRWVTVQAAHNGKDLFFRLEWADPTENQDYADGAAFPDAAAVLFPFNGVSPLELMGSPEAPLNAWYWRASRSQGESLVFRGFGTEEEETGPPIQTRAVWAEGRWSLVITRNLRANAGARVAFAVWEGSSQERAGLHSYTRDWEELVIR